MPQPTKTSLYSNRDRWHAASAGYLGWTLDAFDFFVVVFLVDVLAANFHVSKAAIVWSLTATLAMRPVGAVIFGLLADRFGRRKLLIANVLFFSTMELLTGFSPNYAVFLVLRILYGIGMGGEWGVGASLVMETAPPSKRGLLSGILQSGYSMGYLLAAIVARFALPTLGWRAMFWLGGAPALLAFYISSQVKESEAWEHHRAAKTSDVLRSALVHWKTVLYLAFMMTLMNGLSHGTQDLYPDFLKSAKSLSAATVAYLAILYNIGAILGGVLFGHYSERLGRRRGMLCALAVSLAVIPIWAFGSTLAVLAAGAFLMQVGVQGAWGVIPAHLNEMAPDNARGLIPGFAYQIGILFASPTNSIEFALRDRLGYSWALTSFEIGVICLLAITLLLGRERRGHRFIAEEQLRSVPAGVE